MPAVWLSWSIFAFTATFVTFVWQIGAVEDTKPHLVTRAGALAPRIVVSILLILGVAQFMLVVSTLRHYGSDMDRAWKRRIESWMEDKDNVVLYPLQEVPSLSIPEPYLPVRAKSRAKFYGSPSEPIKAGDADFPVVFTNE